MTIYYEPHDFNEITVLFRWKGTVLPMVLCRPAVWVLVSAHVAFLYLHLYRPEVEMPTMPWKLVGIPTSLLTFFLSSSPATASLATTIYTSAARA